MEKTQICRRARTHAHTKEPNNRPNTQASKHINTPWPAWPLSALVSGGLGGRLLGALVMLGREGDECKTVRLD